MPTITRFSSPRACPAAAFAAACVLAAFAAGCAHRVGDERSRHAAAFSEELEARTTAALSTSSELTLEDCVRIAMENNLAMKARQIRSRLASLERQAAFSAFLPTIELGFDYSETDHQQAVWTGSGYVAMSDKAVTRASVVAMQPVFLPSAWLMYSMRKNHEEIALLVEQRTRQLITLRVTSAYFASLAHEGITPALEAGVRQARALVGEMRALEREGLAMRSDREKAEALLAAREADVAVNRRAVIASRIALLDAMGLAPRGDLRLSVPAYMPADGRELPEQILAAMHNRLELHVADKAVERSDAGVRAAIADFLPSLFLVGSYDSSTDGYLRYSDLWTGGVRGVLTVFDGFENVARYRVARAMREEAFARREEQCMAVMLEVLYARLQAENAAEALRVAQANAKAAESALMEIEARAREDIATQSARMDAMAARDAAAAGLTVARYRQQVTFATLRDVTGTLFEEETK